MRKNCVTNGICFFLVFSESSFLEERKSRRVGAGRGGGFEKAAKICVYVYVDEEKLYTRVYIFPLKPPQAPCIFLHISRRFFRGGSGWF